ncbi:glutamate--cysteine ligase [Embleya sp. NPDC020630]|uniref:glutamate--cysteine ligase n=1 Tax=Embleya sp. NPDC020630 TaxID=3363979 RepID=UPI0037879F33
MAGSRFTLRQPESPARSATREAPAVVTPTPTMGVEEEFLLVDARTGAPAPRAELVVAKAADADTTRLEATRYQVESASLVAHTADELRAHLVRSRRDWTEAAAVFGCRLVAGATPVIAPAPGPLLIDAPRRHEQSTRYGDLTDTFVNCGCHIHVGTLDPETAVQVTCRLRPWLPTLIALGANSPFRDEHDTGHASWRSVVNTTWPCSGIPPRLTSVSAYEHAVAGLIATGAIKDRKMIYWDARPSASWPTVEVRAPDVATTVDEAVLLAVLVRALVADALTWIRAGEPAPDIPAEVLVAARWRAARDGLEGMAVHPERGELVPANTMVDALIERVRDHLDAAGDLPHVARTLAGLRRDGCGARRQRLVFERRHRYTDVVRYLADATEQQGG